MVPVMSLLLLSVLCDFLLLQLFMPSTFEILDIVLHGGF